jgi:hypothetical protein
MYGATLWNFERLFCACRSVAYAAKRANQE